MGQGMVAGGGEGVRLDGDSEPGTRDGGGMGAQTDNTEGA